MNQSTNPLITQSPTHPISQFPIPKAEWTPPVLRITPIAETAGSKANAIGDGTDAFSS